MTTEREEQDLFLKCLLEANVDGIIAFDNACQYTLWNRAMEKFSGVKREDVMGKSAFELFPRLKDTGEDKFYLDALAGNTVVAENRPYDFPETNRTGFFDGYYSPRHDEQGAVVGGVAIIRDVTDRKRADDVNARLAAIVESSDDAVISEDLNGLVVSSFRRWRQAAH